MNRIRNRLRSFGIVLSGVPIALCSYGCDCRSKQKAPDDSATKAESPATTEKPREPLIKKQEIVDWCPEHGVPESLCTRCNSALIEGFKKKGDWCKEHDLPESQCTQCHPELKEKFEAMRPKEKHGG